MTERQDTAQQSREDAARAVAETTDAETRQPDDPEELREQIQETREELGETVEALAQKADVKARVQEKVADRKEQLHDAQVQAKAKLGATAEEARQRPLALGAAAIVGGLVLLWLIRRK